MPNDRTTGIVNEEKALTADMLQLECTSVAYSRNKVTL